MSKKAIVLERNKSCSCKFLILFIINPIEFNHNPSVITYYEA